MLSNYNLKSLAFAAVLVHICFGVSKGHLQTGFYSQTCPEAETIVLNVVRSAVSDDHRIAAKLLRLFFHDCFVQGCDGSILVDDGERNAREHLGVGGFEVIENAKTELEENCPGVVSCADIVALAARDAVFLSKGPFIEVPTGRRDGLISEVGLAADLPDVDDSTEVLKSKFQHKGLSDKDLLLLSAGGHSIGTTACFFMPNRLYNFHGEGDSDPEINPRLLPQLKDQCPFDGDSNVRIPLDLGSESTFDAHIFQNIRNGFAVIASDARLYDDRNIKKMVDTYAQGFSRSRRRRSSFQNDFAVAMVKLGTIGVKTGEDGEIRRVCNALN
ncbi:peroxidase 43-like [Mercurialis annua]|uniref:peroxidase 43-like n=1 Tax=Mercurialis annua TaxID=3986 RepID=UPI002160FBBA|nr:peroxidase 43-like [Mercurialis annua]